MEAGSAQSTAIRFGKISGLGARLKSSIQAAQNFLFARQHEDGWWCGELEADTTLESDYIFLHTVLGTRDERRFQQCAEEILRHQNAGRRLADLPRRTLECERQREGVLCAEDVRLFAR